MTPDQPEFDFDAGRESGGLEAWRAAREREMKETARKLGIPLGRRVRVEFPNGPPLEGRIELNEQLLFAPSRFSPTLHLRIGNADFHFNETESITALD
jgi:hypothetical protein